MISERIPSVYVDWDSEILYDRKFFAEAGKECPSMNIMLSPSSIDEIVDDMRIASGFLPITPIYEDYEEDGWYNYHLDVFLTENGTVVANHITAIVQIEGAPDDFAEYEIALTEEERDGIMRRLDHLFLRRCGMTCEEIIREEDSENDYS